MRRRPHRCAHTRGRRPERTPGIAKDRPCRSEAVSKANSAALAAQRAAEAFSPSPTYPCAFTRSPPPTTQLPTNRGRAAPVDLADLATRTVHDIKRRDVIAVIDDIAAERGSHMANKTPALLGCWFSRDGRSNQPSPARPEHTGGRGLYPTRFDTSQANTLLPNNTNKWLS